MSVLDEILSKQSAPATAPTVTKPTRISAIDEILNPKPPAVLPEGSNAWAQTVGAAKDLLTKATQYYKKQTEPKPPKEPKPEKTPFDMPKDMQPKGFTYKPTMKSVASNLLPVGKELAGMGKGAVMEVGKIAKDIVLRPQLPESRTFQGAQGIGQNIGDWLHGLTTKEPPTSTEPPVFKATKPLPPVTELSPEAQKNTARTWREYQRRLSTKAETPEEKFMGYVSWLHPAAFAANALAKNTRSMVEGQVTPEQAGGQAIADMGTYSAITTAFHIGNKALFDPFYQKYVVGQKVAKRGMVVPPDKVNMSLSKQEYIDLAHKVDIGQASASDAQLLGTVNNALQEQYNGYMGAFKNSEKVTLQVPIKQSAITSVPKATTQQVPGIPVGKLRIVPVKEAVQAQTAPVSVLDSIIAPEGISPASLDKTLFDRYTVDNGKNMFGSFDEKGLSLSNKATKEVNQIAILSEASKSITVRKDARNIIKILSGRTYPEYKAAKLLQLLQNPDEINTYPGEHYTLQSSGAERTLFENAITKMIKNEDFGLPAKGMLDFVQEKSLPGIDLKGKVGELVTAEQGHLNPEAFQAPKEIPLEKYDYAPPSEQSLKEYKAEVLKNTEELPKLEQNIEWTPPTIGYNNPYTKMVSGALKWVAQKGTQIPGIRALMPQEGRPQEALTLLKEKMRVGDGLYRSAKDEFIRPILRLKLQEKQKLGLMINKYMQVPAEQKEYVKSVDTAIASLGKAISGINKDWIDQGWIKPDESFLSEETFMENLGQYARTFYVKTKGGKPALRPFLGRSANEIQTSMFKRKMTLENWGDKALEFQGKMNPKAIENISFIGDNNAVLFRKAGLDTIDKIAKASRTKIQKILPDIVLFDFKGVPVADRIAISAKNILEKYEMVETPVDKLRQIGLDAKNAYGWVTQADVMLDKTFKDLAGNYSTMSYLDNIKKQPALFSDKPREGWLVVKDLLPKGVERDKRLGPLNGGYYHPGMEQDLASIIKGKPTGWDRAVGDIVGLWKISKTAGSPGAMSRNYLSGNFIQTDLAGAPVWDLRNTPVYLKGIKEYVTKGPRYKFWAKNGLYGGDYFSVEVNPAIVDQFVKGNDLASVGEWLTTAADKTKKWVADKTKYYGSIDHFARTYLAEWSLQKGATPAQAVAFANKWQLDYRVVPEIIDKLRRGAIGGVIVPFVSFYYLMAPRILEVFASRPWVLFKYLAIFTALGALSRAKLGISKQEEEAMKPEWMAKNSDWVILLPNKDRHGNPQWLNLSYTLPFGSDPRTGFVDVTDLKNMANGGAPIQTELNLMRNYDPFMQSEIYKKTDTTSEKIKKEMAYRMRSYLPGVYTDTERLLRSIKGERYGYPFKLERQPFQAALRFLGISTYSGGFNEWYKKVTALEKEIQAHKFEIALLETDPNLSKNAKTKENVEHMQTIKDLTKKLVELTKAGGAVSKFGGKR